MLFDLALLVAGVAMLYFGAEWLVNGASRVGLALGIRPLVIGLTIVSYGTSAPELSVSVLAAAGGQPDVALGNVVGSNVANIGLILGVTALVAPPRSDGAMLRMELPAMAIATLLLPLVLWSGEIGSFEGAALLAGSVVFTLWTVRNARKPPTTAEEAAEPLPPTSGIWRSLGLGLLGLGVLLAGGEAFVTGSTAVAKTLGMSDLVVGLTIVAVGTSLPELATSLVAALRGHPELALGNVVGSNIFNILLILGVASLVEPIPGSLQMLSSELMILGVLTVGCIASLSRARAVSRWEGTVYVSVYVLFIVHTLFANLG